MTANGRLPAIDLLRFAAAFFVMTFHFGYWSWAPPRGVTREVMLGAVSYPHLIYLTWWGWIGVPVFFVISGYVISMSAERSANAQQFFRARFLRLFPGALVCATVTLVVAYNISLYSGADLSLRYLKSLVFWPRGPWIDGVYWTLPVEVAFYGLVFLLIYLGRLHWLEKTAICAGVASTVAFFLNARLPVELTTLLLLRHGTFFAVGVILWKTASEGWGRSRTLCLAVMIVGSLVRIQSEAIEKASYVGISSLSWVPTTLWLLAISAVGRAHAISLFNSASISKIIVVAGLATYPLYLLHAVVGAALIRILVAQFDIGQNVALVAVIFAMVALATIVTLTLERWVRAWLSRLGWPSSVRSSHANSS